MEITATADNRKIQQAAASMAIERMYVDSDIVTDLMKAVKGKKTYDDIRQKVIQKYVR